MALLQQNITTEDLSQFDSKNFVSQQVKNDLAYYSNFLNQLTTESENLQRDGEQVNFQQDKPDLESLEVLSQQDDDIQVQLPLQPKELSMMSANANLSMSFVDGANQKLSQNFMEINSVEDQDPELAFNELKQSSAGQKFQQHERLSDTDPFYLNYQTRYKLETNSFDFCYSEIDILEEARLYICLKKLRQKQLDRNRVNLQDLRGLLESQRELRKFRAISRDIESYFYFVEALIDVTVLNIQNLKYLGVAESDTNFQKPLQKNMSRNFSFLVEEPTVLAFLTRNDSLLRKVHDSVELKDQNIIWLTFERFHRIFNQNDDSFLQQQEKLTEFIKQGQQDVRLVQVMKSTLETYAQLRQGIDQNCLPFSDLQTQIKTDGLQITVSQAEQLQMEMIELAFQLLDYMQIKFIDDQLDQQNLLSKYAQALDKSQPNYGHIYQTAEIATLLVTVIIIGKEYMTFSLQQVLQQLISDLNNRLAQTEPKVEQFLDKNDSVESQVQMQLEALHNDSLDQHSIESFNLEPNIPQQSFQPFEIQKISPITSSLVDKNRNVVSLSSPMMQQVKVAQKNISVISIQNIDNQSLEEQQDQESAKYNCLLPITKDLDQRSTGINVASFENVDTKLICQQSETDETKQSKCSVVDVLNGQNENDVLDQDENQNLTKFNEIINKLELLFERIDPSYNGNDSSIIEIVNLFSNFSNALISSSEHQQFESNSQKLLSQLFVSLKQIVNPLQLTDIGFQNLVSCFCQQVDPGLLPIIDAYNTLNQFFVDNPKLLLVELPPVQQLNVPILHSKSLIVQLKPFISKLQPQFDNQSAERFVSEIKSFISESESVLNPQNLSENEAQTYYHLFQDSLRLFDEQVSHNAVILYAKFQKELNPFQLLPEIADPVLNFWAQSSNINSMLVDVYKILRNNLTKASLSKENQDYLQRVLKSIVVPDVPLIIKVFVKIGEIMNKEGEATHKVATSYGKTIQSIGEQPQLCGLISQIVNFYCEYSQVLNPYEFQLQQFDYWLFLALSENEVVQERMLQSITVLASNLHSYLNPFELQYCALEVIHQDWVASANDHNLESTRGILDVKQKLLSVYQLLGEHKEHIIVQFVQQEVQLSGLQDTLKQLQELWQIANLSAAEVLNTFNIKSVQKIDPIYRQVFEIVGKYLQILLNLLNPLSLRNQEQIATYVQLNSVIYQAHESQLLEQTEIVLLQIVELFQQREVTDKQQKFTYLEQLIYKSYIIICQTVPFIQNRLVVGVEQQLVTDMFIKISSVFKQQQYSSEHISSLALKNSSNLSKYAAAMFLKFQSLVAIDCIDFPSHLVKFVAASLPSIIEQEIISTGSSIYEYFSKNSIESLVDLIQQLEQENEIQIDDLTVAKNNSDSQRLSLPSQEPTGAIQQSLNHLLLPEMKFTAIPQFATLSSNIQTKQSDASEQKLIKVQEQTQTEQLQEDVSTEMKAKQLSTSNIFPGEEPLDSDCEPLSDIVLPVPVTPRRNTQRIDQLQVQDDLIEQQKEKISAFEARIQEQNGRTKAILEIMLRFKEDLVQIVRIREENE